MALGNTYNNNGNQSQVKEPSVYSPYKLNNAESSVDQTCMRFSYWNNQLKITISPRKQNTGDQVMFDYDNGLSIYLTHAKARIFADVLVHFLEDRETYDNTGVNSGQGLITISQGKEFNSDSPLIIIRKIDENGSVMSSFAYQIKAGFYFAVKNYKEDGTYERDMSYDDLEIRQLITILKEFYESSTYATAYSVVDALKFTNRYQQNMISSIANKLGVEYTGGNKSGYTSKSYFNNPSNGGSSGQSSYGSDRGYTQGTLDDIG